MPAAAPFGRQIPTDADILRLRSSGGSLTIQASGRTVVGIRLHRERGRRTRLRAWIPLETPQAGLEAEGWQRAPNGDLLERSWAVESPADREQLRRDLSAALDVLDADAGRPGWRLTVRHATAIDEVDDIFCPALVLSALGSTLGAVAGLVVAALGAGLAGFVVILLGLAAALAGGFATGVVGYSPVLRVAARIRPLRTRPHAAWVTYAIAGPALVAALIAAMVTRAPPG